MATTSTTLRIEPFDVARRLADFDLTPEVITDSVRAGALERASASDFDPPSYGGIAGWAHTTRRLREHVMPTGFWDYRNAFNCPLTINLRRGVAFAVLLGSEGTGDATAAADRIPTTKYPKGVTLSSQVKVNQRCQCLLFPEDQPRFAPRPSSSELLTYLLLIRPEFAPGEALVQPISGTHIAWAELSLPSALDENGMVVWWAERIILDPVRLDGVPYRQSPPHEDLDGGEIDIPISPR